MKKHEPEVYRIYDKLKDHKGEQNAISCRALAHRFFGIMTTENGKRKVKEVINIIRNDSTFDNVIASCNRGYYWATVEEQDKALRRVMSQLISCARTVRATEKKIAANGQLMFKLSPYMRQAVESLCEVGE